MDRDATLFQSLGDPTRLRLLNLLARTKGICVCELVDALKLPQYAISRQLRVLVGAGLVEGVRSGKWIYYRINQGLRPPQSAALRAVELLRTARRDFREDEARAGERLRLRRDGLCCVGLVSAAPSKAATRTHRRNPTAKRAPEPTNGSPSGAELGAEADWEAGINGP